jgi:HPt (histidine-containing phosphotransfer) domain-containing protein
MELDEHQLKEKALLLLQRERELFELRMKDERLLVWLSLTQALPEIFSAAGVDLNDAYLRLRKVLLEGLKLQRVLFFAIEGSALLPVAPTAAPRTVGPEVLAILREDLAGVVNDSANTSEADLAEALGLGRFMWSRLEVSNRAPVILAAGYDRAKAKFHSGFDASDVANLRNATQHIQGLIGNAVLAQQVREDRDRLKHTNQILERRESELHAMAEALRAANETLEQRVTERTEQLGRRNRDMRLVLDNVVTALLTIDVDARLSEERSAKVDQWFGAYEGTPLFVDYIGKSDPDFAARFAVAHEALVDRYLPVEVCLEQLPRRLCSKDRIYHCSYRPILAGPDNIGLLIMIEDVTERVRLAREEAEQGELLAVFQGLARDRAGFVGFFEEATHLVNELARSDVDDKTRRRHLHTLKGNAAMMGANVVADLCHQAESELTIDGAAIGAIIGRLQERWLAIGQTLDAVAGERGRDVVEIPTVVFEELCAEIGRCAAPVETCRRLASFRFEPIERPLTRLSKYAHALARRMGKAALSVAVESDEARVDPRRFGSLWAVLVHLVRNAVDHGIEPQGERIAQGKSPGGRLTLRGSHTSRELTIEIEDDGRGIDWDRVAELAGQRGLPNDTETHLLRAILSDGFSTRSSVTAISGRGTGMSAVQHEITKIGGALSVLSRKGRGTCWQIKLPFSEHPHD